MKNPKWTRDELILTLNFYHLHYPTIPNKNSLEIKELSEKLQGILQALSYDQTQSARNQKVQKVKF